MQKHLAGRGSFWWPSSLPAPHHLPSSIAFIRCSIPLFHFGMSFLLRDDDLRCFGTPKHFIHFTEPPSYLEWERGGVYPLHWWASNNEPVHAPSMPCNWQVLRRQDVRPNTSCQKLVQKSIHLTQDIHKSNLFLEISLEHVFISSCLYSIAIQAELDILHPKLSTWSSVNDLLVRTARAPLSNVKGWWTLQTGSTTSSPDNVEQHVGILPLDVLQGPSKGVLTQARM